MSGRSVVASVALVACLAHRAAAVRLVLAPSRRLITRATPVLMMEVKEDLHSPDDWLVETNQQRVGDLAAVARKYSPAKEDEFERVERVAVVSYDDDGFEIEEVLCSVVDNSCIAVNFDVAWPEGAVATAKEMADAFAALAKAAKPRSVTDDYDNAPKRRVFESQGERLRGLRDMLNTRFEPHLRVLALVHARDVISPTEELEQAQMTQMNFEGFTLQIVSSDLAAWSEEAEKRKAQRKGAEDQGPRQTTEVSILFDEPCHSEQEVEDKIVELTLETALDT